MVQRTPVAISKDGSQVAVAGRNVFKIFDADDENQTFNEAINLRVGKNLNLNFSCNDVAWNHVDEALLATGATNGAVVIWNLRKTTRSKMESVFQNHKRTVNKISFHPNEPHLLLTGSQDGTMMLFDLRTKSDSEPANVFYSSSESVRDVQFCPHQSHTFASVQENGNVQLWDFRRTDKVDRQFTAHNGPVFAIDWHPEERRWLATAGRDKSIKVWDVSSKINCEYQVNTIASVARIKWRPNRKFYIASSSLVMDFSLNVWDIRRPYIPYAVFTSHKNVTTGFAWRSDPRTIISAGKDNTLCHHVFDDAHRPANHANPVAFGMNNHGDITVAISDHILKHINSTPGAASAAETTKTETRHATASTSSSAMHSHSYGSPVADRPSGNLLNSIFNLAPNPFRDGKLSAVFKRSQSHGEQFKDCTSSLKQYKNQNVDKALSMDWFVISALRYQLSGKPFHELCLNNADVASHLDRPQVAQTWKMIAQLYGASGSRMNQYSGGSYVSVSDTIHETKDSSELNSASRHPSGSLGGNISNRHYSGNSRTMGTQTPKPQVFFNPEEPAGLTDTDEESEVNGDKLVDGDVFAPMVSHGDNSKRDTNFFFGEAESGYLAGLDLTTSLLGGDEALIGDESTDVLPREAFNMRHIIPPFSVPYWCQTDYIGCESPSLAEVPHELEDSTDDGGYASATAPNDIDALCQSLLSSFVSAPQPFDASETVADMLEFYVLQGDIQTSVSALIVLGDRLKGSPIAQLSMECWFTSYIELLARFQLWNAANQVIKLSPLPAINQLNQTSTTLKVSCNVCGKTSNKTRGPWTCANCSTRPSQCSVCHIRVAGLYVWCQGCSHGGHVEHMQEWMAISRYCPTGCGHQCEYT
ncbi:GATOR complex protein WDR24 [Halotydeus destructor]|nr:GATOR complex protein WDR24 [Halotydeus destructor]